jgi:GTP-binding protein
MNNYKEKMLESWELVPPFFVSSAEKGIGKKEILQYIRKINISNQKM